MNKLLFADFSRIHETTMSGLGKKGLKFSETGNVMRKTTTGNEVFVLRMEARTVSRIV
jgi:hypothetical protein